MKFRFLAIATIIGMVFAGCSSNQQNDDADSLMSDTSMVDTATFDTMGTGMDTTQIDTGSNTGSTARPGTGTGTEPGGQGTGTTPPPATTP